MGKISQVTSKYIVQATIQIEGVVDRPDIIGAVFGQTEGLLGSDLELRELQRSGRIGRIEVTVQVKGGKTSGTVVIPSSLDKTETSIIAAALEVIQRIGPCNAKLHVQKIEDIRISKRKYVVERAKQLLKQMIDGVMPDSAEIAQEVAQSVRVMELVEYGRERLPAGPAIDDMEEILIVEGRADVLVLLKHGFKNAIAMNGTSCPKSLIELCKTKEVTVFVDGDRGGDLIIKELIQVAEIDFVTKAPDGKEVEELTKKEIHKALRSHINAEQAKLEYSGTVTSLKRKHMSSDRPDSRSRPPSRGSTRPSSRDRPVRTERRPTRRTAPVLSSDEKKKFSKMIESLVGTHGAYLLDEKQAILGKVPLSELATTIKSLPKGNVYAVLFDGSAEKDIVEAAERAGIQHMVAMDSKVKPRESEVNIIIAEAL